MIRVGGTEVAVNDVEIAGHLAYVSDPSFGLRVFDVSDPAAPVPIGELEVTGAGTLAVEGRLAFLTTQSGGVQLIDVSEPSAPRARGVFDDPNCRGPLAAVDGRLYAGGFDFCVVDVSRPAAPRKLGFVAVPGSVTDIEVSGDLAYVATSIFPYPSLDDLGSLQVIEVSRARAPRVLSGVVVDSAVVGLVVAGDIAWLSRSGLLTSIDVSDPAQIRELTSFELPHWSWIPRIARQGSLALVTEGSRGITAVDLTDPLAPVPLGSLDTPGWPRGVAMVGELAFVADGSSLQVIDVSNPHAPFERSHHETPLPALSLALADGRAYVAGGDWISPGFLEILDVSAPSTPSLLGSLSLPLGVSDIALMDDVVVLAGNEFRTIDVSDPAEPMPLGQLDGYTRSVAVSGTLALLDGMKLDLSDPGSPAPDGFMSFWGNGFDLAGDLVYAAGWSLQIGDLATGALLGTSPQGAHSASCVDVAGDTAFLGEIGPGGLPGHGAGWLRIVDVSDPAAPFDLVTVKTHGAVHDVEVVGERAYLATAGDSGNVVVLDVSDPGAPTELGAFTTPGSQAQLEVAAGLVHLADGEGGLRIIDFGPEYEEPRASPPLLVGLEIAAGARDRIKRGRRTVDAAILGSERVSAADVDVASLALGENAAPAIGRPRLRDVDGDGRADLLVTFAVEGAPLGSGASQVCVRGLVAGGRRILGCDEVDVLAR